MIAADAVSGSDFRTRLLHQKALADQRPSFIADVDFASALLKESLENFEIGDHEVL